MYAVGLLPSGWRPPVIEEDLGVEDEVQQDGLVSAARTTVLIDFEWPLERLCFLLATAICQNVRHVSSSNELSIYHNLVKEHDGLPTMSSFRTLTTSFSRMLWPRKKG
jgi:hypothetical protein